MRLGTMQSNPAGAPRRASDRNLLACAGPGNLVSTDIFDTILLRRPVSERRRMSMIARVFVSRVSTDIDGPTAAIVRRARWEAQHSAYKELDTSGRRGEVRIEDILERQVILLGLPRDHIAELIRAELLVEQKLLHPNRALIGRLEELRGRGVRVIGISDTSLSASHLQSLMEAVIGRNVLDRLYTSADLQLTKRSGEIFTAVLREEATPFSDLIHIGDDRHADVRMPRKLGAACLHLPRSSRHVALRRLDGTLFEALRRRSEFPKAPRRNDGRTDYLRRFGERTLGPIVAEFCMRLWLYLSTASTSEQTTVAFCARGGLNMRVAFEAFMRSTGLPLDMRRSDLMISRVVAARAAILAESAAASDELAREFSGATMADTARAVAAIDDIFGPEWNTSFEAQGFFKLLRGTAAGRRVRQMLEEQDELFVSHLRHCIGKAKRIILCDTGLYGSTLRLLQAGHPEFEWECVLFARCNYKGFDASHFARTAGLSVDKDGYNPFEPRTSVLRYWHLIEALFEPRLPSVRFFTWHDGIAQSNLEQAGWREILETERSPALSGVIAYLDALDSKDWFRRLASDTDLAWPTIHAALIFPDAIGSAALRVVDRSRDFGRDEVVHSPDAAPATSLVKRMGQARTALWKEGAVALMFPALRWPLQLGIESAYCARSACRLMKRWMRW
ncbi:hypothetical protein AB4Y32_39750 [Paraburkholderia phymatum]|uniref:Uncharacterized protein n=1 Tax=Paraburkholderia phymatum TaxID=148447 RepID=A0ACC6UDX8_9BURK